MSGYTERFRGIIATYVEELEKAEKNRKPFGGLFGFGQGPGDYPCHETMDRQVAELTAEAADTEESPEETAELVKTVLQAETSRKWPEAARLALLAIQRHTLPLIARMSPEDRGEISAWYADAYPRRRRLPVQRQIVKELGR